MDAKFVDILGEEIAPESLALPKARELAQLLTSGSYRFGSLRSASRRPDGAEAVIAELSVEVGQEPVHDVRDIEPIAMLFSARDGSYPEAISLRPDFPQVPHLQLRDEEFPKGLCLYEEPYSTVKLTWTGARFLERIRAWFRDTARDALHREDQPLEPLLLTGRSYLIVPSDLFARGAEDTPDKLLVIPRACNPDAEFFVARRPEQVTPLEQRQAVNYLATTFQCQPQTHGVIRKAPKNLLDLQNLSTSAGLDLLATLRERMLNWNRGDAPLNARLVLIVFFPKSRSAGKPPEVPDIWAFLTIESIRDIGVQLGFWQALPNGQVAALVGSDMDSQKSASVNVYVLHPLFALDRYRAALLNGYTPSTARITAVGLGALGSQVLAKLIRSGFGSWCLIDNDYLIPHNIARHELSQSAVGFPKADTMQFLSNHILEDQAVMEAIVADVLAPREKGEQVARAITGADVIFDFSASVPVARHLAVLPGGPRRASAFLNPTATDLAVLIEDSQRCTMLDNIEMQYYRLLLHHQDLSGHLIREHNQPIRYSQSCRDLTSSIPEDLVGLHSAIAAKALREVLDNAEASIAIWRASAERSVTVFRRTPAPTIEAKCGAWRLRSDTGLVARVSALRTERLPNETGGVLVGAFDLDRRIIYIADVVPSPPDSKEWPVLYIRGCEGLTEQLEMIDQVTGGMLQYVGEWHTHPDGYSTNPSGDDRKVFSWLAEHMATEGLPPVMAIVGQGGSVRWFAGSLD